ncbi:MAG TPA: YaeQ family protein, partial [Kofleriaceae bacterium]
MHHDLELLERVDHLGQQALDRLGIPVAGGHLGRWNFVLKPSIMQRMALSATMRKVEISLSDSDRGIYEQLDLRVAQHPSESDRYLVARVLARALEHGEGLEFSKGGVSDDTEPALVQRDLRGDLVAWI